MLKTSTLIESFKKQTKNTILDHLGKLGINHAVYSTLLNGFEPDLKEKNVMIYIHAKSMVVVCFDLCGEIDETADEGNEWDADPPHYYSYKGSRISPVNQLEEAMMLMRYRLLHVSPNLNIYCVLLSESNILNANDMEGMWKAKRIKVFCKMEGLREMEITTNKTHSKQAESIMNAILTDPDAEAEPTPDEDFEKLLNMFINEGCEIIDEDESEDSDSLDDINLDDYPKGSVHRIEDISFPDGKVVQNHNITVYVDILRPISDPRNELDKLVGCTNIKKHMDELIALTKYNKMMQKLFPHSKQHEVSLHSVFYGKPGTGKTTVCKIFGSLLRQAGALSKGHVVVCDRGTFLGTLWGDEERSMRQVLEMAQGGVLMIDEAYMLNGKHESDPGKIVIQLLLNTLADETQRDIAIVLCGYKEPLEEMLNANPGLQSRFPNKFEFADFTIDELLEITLRRIRDYEYQFTPDGWDRYRQILTQAYQQRNPHSWGNARFVSNQLERIYIQHASRCIKDHLTDKLQLRLITSEDIMPIEAPREKKRIGF